MFFVDLSILWPTELTQFARIIHQKGVILIAFQAFVLVEVDGSLQV